MPGGSKKGGGLTTKKSTYGAPFKMKGSPYKALGVVTAIRSTLDKHIPTRKGYKPTSSTSTTTTDVKNKSSKSESFWSKLINR